MGALSLFAGSVCCAHFFLCLFSFPVYFSSLKDFELFCATYSDERPPLLRGRGRAALQPPALLTGWITHGRSQEAKCHVRLVGF